MEIPTTEQLIPPKRAGRELNVSYGTIRYLLITGKLNGYKVGSLTYVVDDDLYEAEKAKRDAKEVS